MKTDEQDDLWRLLGRAKEPTVSPFFSRNVLRAIREEKQEKPGVFAVLARQWSWIALTASTCVVLAVSFVAFHAPHSGLPQVGLTSVGHLSAPPEVAVPQGDAVVLLAQQVSTSPDYQVINHLDELLASEETSVWLDK